MMMMNQDNKPTRDALVVCITQYADLDMPAEITKIADGAEKLAQVSTAN